MDYKVNYYEIEVLSPTTVTSGDKIPSFQVVVDRNKAYVIDILKMIKSNKKVLDVVETFNFNFNSNNESISSKLKDARIEYKNYAKYVLDYNSTTYRIREINEIMKTAGRPYIPGSSIKGAVRSVLSRAINKEDVYLRSFNNAISKRKDIKYFDNEAEEEIFGNPNYSPFRFLNISDTEVVDFSSLELCDIKVLNVCNGKVKWFAGRENIDDIQRAVSIHTEALKKGTRLKGKISSGFVEYFIENRFTGIKNIESVLNYIKKIKTEVSKYIESEIEFYNKYNTGELTNVVNFYKNLLNMRLAENEFLLQVGFSTGYKPKSVIKNINGDFIEKLKVVSKGKVYEDRFPKTRRLVYKNGKVDVPLGWVKVTLR